MFKKVFLHNPTIYNNEIKYIKKCLNSGWITNGDYIDKFTNIVKKFTKVKYAIPCINGTSALHISLKVLNIEEGDEVIVPSTTFIAPINAVMYNMAKPIFMDVDKYFTIDTNKTLEYLKNNTYLKKKYCFNKKTHRKIKAIIIVHTFGNAADIEKLFIFCRNRNISIVEDAAESLGTKYTKGRFKNRHTGTVGNIGCLSFNSNKIITAAGGGMILTNSATLAKKSIYLINQAKNDSVKYIHDEVGYNYRFNNIQSAIGFAQMQNIDKILKKKIKIRDYYEKKLLETNKFQLVSSPLYSKNNYWLNIIKFKNINYNKLILICKKLQKKGIETRPIWYLNHLQKPYIKCERYKIDNATKLQNSCLCLPSGLSLNNKELKTVTEEIFNLF